MDVPIFVINLKKDVKKKEVITHSLNKLNFKFEVEEAVLGSDLSDEYKLQVSSKSEAIDSISRELTDGEIGCALSHINICKKMVDKSIPYAIILEDDAVILKDIREVFKIVNFLPKSLDVLLLGYYSDPVSEKKSDCSIWGKENFNGVGLVRLIESGFGTHGYLISLKGANKMINILDDKISRPIDHYTGTEKFMNMYATDFRYVGLHQDLKLQSNISVERNVKNSDLKSMSLKDKFRRYKILLFFRRLLHNVTIILKKVLPLKKYV